VFCVLATRRRTMTRVITAGLSHDRVHPRLAALASRRQHRECSPRALRRFDTPELAGPGWPCHCSRSIDSLHPVDRRAACFRPPRGCWTVSVSTSPSASASGRSRSRAASSRTALRPPVRRCLALGLGWVSRQYVGRAGRGRNDARSACAPS
jgi:hypothetical protein